jgi:hypothetical protein
MPVPLARYAAGFDLTVTGGGVDTMQSAVGEDGGSALLCLYVSCAVCVASLTT